MPVHGDREHWRWGAASGQEGEFVERIPGIHLDYGAGTDRPGHGGRAALIYEIPDVASVLEWVGSYGRRQEDEEHPGEDDGRDDQRRGESFPHEPSPGDTGKRDGPHDE